MHKKILKELGVFGVILHAPNQKSQNEGCLLQETIIFSTKQIVIDFKTIPPFFDTAKWVLQQHSPSIAMDRFYRIGSAAALKLCQSPSVFFFPYNPEILFLLFLALHSCRLDFERKGFLKVPGILTKVCLINTQLRLFYKR